MGHEKTAHHSSKPARVKHRRDQHSRAPHLCPQCGAELPPDQTCRALFERCLVKDYEQPATYGAVHHLVVACYMLQHNEYSRRAWLGARQLVAQVIREGASPARLLQKMQPHLNSNTRTWKIVGEPKIAEVEAIVWTRTIADMRLDSAESYVADAHGWANSILADTEDFVRKLAHVD